MTPAYMSALYARAQAEHLWFWSHYQGLWFSPAELLAEQERGKFCWGADNWKLRPPSEMINEAEQTVRAAQFALAELQARVAKA